jgi:hypothetical protein
MQRNYKKIENPLTIIGVFAGITEILSSAALPFLQSNTQSLFTWFLVLFPFVLILLFFGTLNFNREAFYAPGDFKDQRDFLELIKLSRKPITVTSPNDLPSNIAIVEDNTESKDLSIGSTRDEINKVNEVFKYFGERAKSLFEERLIDAYMYGSRGEGLFLVTLILKDKEIIGPDDENRIIQSRTLDNGLIELCIVENGIKCNDPRKFSDLLFWDLRDSILSRRALMNYIAKQKMKSEVS